MTYVHREHIDHPSAWTSRSIGGKLGLVYRLEPRHLDAFDGILAATSHTEPLDVMRPQFEHPAIEPMMAEIRDILLKGRGSVIISGLTRERYSDEQFERMYWGFGLHLGVPISQSYRGDCLGRVTQTETGPDNPADRGYKGSGELRPHTDNNASIVGLMCVQKAAEGGYSLLASSAAIHNAILATRPELLDVLYEGYYMTSQEATLRSNPHEDLRIPVFSYVDGHLSCLFNRGFYERANLFRNDMRPEFDEATKLVEALAQREDIQLRFILEPGEILLVNNYTALHARTTFKDSPLLKRSLLRLWLTVPNGRPLGEAYRLKAVGYQPRSHSAVSAPIA